jgi:3-deoxy-D-manno-octulosonic acid (KDO) 8-phosphate synthase
LSPTYHWMRDAGYRVIFDATHSMRGWRGRGFDVGRPHIAPVLVSRNGCGCDGIHGGTEIRPALRWAESGSAKRFAEAPSHVKAFRCVSRTGGRSRAAETN